MKDVDVMPIDPTENLAPMFAPMMVRIYVVLFVGSFALVISSLALVKSSLTAGWVHAQSAMHSCLLQIIIPNAYALGVSLLYESCAACCCWAGPECDSSSRVRRGPSS